jgi:hypothetical protein
LEAIWGVLEVLVLFEGGYPYGGVVIILMLLNRLLSIKNPANAWLAGNKKADKARGLSVEIVRPVLAELTVTLVKAPGFVKHHVYGAPVLEVKFVLEAVFDAAAAAFFCLVLEVGFEFYEQDVAIEEVEEFALSGCYVRLLRCGHNRGNLQICPY